MLYTREESEIGNGGLAEFEERLCLLGSQSIHFKGILGVAGIFAKKLPITLTPNPPNHGLNKPGACKRLYLGVTG